MLKSDLLTFKKTREFYFYGCFLLNTIGTYIYTCEEGIHL